MERVCLVFRRAILLLLVVTGNGYARTCLVGYKYIFEDGSVGLDVNTGTLDSTSCTGNGDECVKMQGTATASLIGTIQVTGSYEIGYCRSTPCSSPLTCESADAMQEFSKLKDAVDSNMDNSLTEFKSTTCKIAHCSEDDCNSGDVDAIAAAGNIACMTGVSYVTYGTLENGLTSSSCDVSSCSQSCTLVEQTFTLDSSGEGTGTVIKGLCVPTSETQDYNCAGAISSSERESIAQELSAMTIDLQGDCTASHCKTNNCNDRTLAGIPTTTSSSQTTTMATTMATTTTTTRNEIPTGSSRNLYLARFCWLIIVASTLQWFRMK